MHKKKDKLRKTLSNPKSKIIIEVTPGPGTDLAKFASMVITTNPKSMFYNGSDSDIKAKKENLKSKIGDYIGEISIADPTNMYRDRLKELSEISNLLDGFSFTALDNDNKQILKPIKDEFDMLSPFEKESFILQSSNYYFRPNSPPSGLVIDGV